MVPVDVPLLVPSSVTEGGTNVQLECAGRPVQLKLTVCFEPNSGVTVNVTMADWPALMVCEEGVALTEKSGALMVSVTTAEVLPP